MLKNKNITSITLDEISKYSNWPKRLLNFENFEKKIKTEKEVQREFNSDKWGELLKVFSKKKSFSIDDIQNAEVNYDSRIPCYEAKEGFYLANAGYILNKHLILYEKTLIKYSKNASCLIELGAGYGSKLFKLSSKKSFKKLPLIAGEYTDAGCKLIKLISKISNKPVKVSKFDFNELEKYDLKIPKNSIIFTSYALHYSKNLNEKFIDFFVKLKPKAVIFFEPCYELFDENNIYGLMCRRYMILNGYTTNIASTIIKGCKNNGVDFKIKKNVIAMNPFLPISILEVIPNA